MCSVKPLTSRQGEVLEFIREYRDREGFPPSVRDIGGHFGLAPSTVHDHVRALEKKGRLEHQPGLSRSFAPLSKESGARERPQRTHSPGEGIPVVGRVAAGAPILADENIEERVSLPEGWAPPGAFLLRVEGQSMRDAHILDGDLVLVRPQRDASNDEIVVALIEDEATVKRFRKTARGIELRPENPDYAPIEVGPSEGLRVEIVGKVIGVFRPGLDRTQSRVPGESSARNRRKREPFSV
jgi:repressor LexA